LNASSERTALLRPLKLAILFSVLGESIIFVVWGLVLYPGGSVLNKLLWTVLFCGLGMGSAVGALIQLGIVGRLDGAAAVAATTVLGVLVLGVGCNLLCLGLDQHFQFFGGLDNGPLFVWNGVVMSAVGGLAVGTLCFTRRGRRVLERVGW